MPLEVDNDVTTVVEVVHEVPQDRGLKVQTVIQKPIEVKRQGRGVGLGGRRGKHAKAHLLELLESNDKRLVISYPCQLILHSLRFLS